MKKGWTICKIIGKRIGKRPLFCFILLLFPLVLCLTCGIFGSREASYLQIGYVIKTKGETKEVLEIQELLRNRLAQNITEGSCKYQEYPTDEQLRQDLLKGKLAGGFIVEEALFQGIASGNLQNSMTFWVPEGMNYGGLIKEEFTTRIYQVCSAYWFSQMTENKLTAGQVLERLDREKQNGRVFSISFHQRPVMSPEQEQQMVFPIRQLLAFLLFVLALLCAMDGCRDRERKRLIGLQDRKLFAGLSLAVPILWGTLFLCLGLARTGQFYHVDATFRELFALLGYSFLLWCMAYGLSNWGREKVLTGVIPCVLMGAVLCTPAFLSIGEHNILIEKVGKLYPLTWYLMWTAF